MKRNRWIQGTGWLLLCFLCLGFRSRALGQDVILKAEDEKVEVSMGGSAETAVSMSLSLEVELTEGDAEVSFEFAPGIASSIKQYRYEKETGTLNLYISGNQKQRIFQEEEFSLGKVVLDPGTGGSASATVCVKEDSLVIVNDAYDMRQEEINVPSAQKISVGTREDGPDTGTGDEPEDGPDSDTGAGDEPADGGEGNIQPGSGSGEKNDREPEADSDRKDHSSGGSKSSQRSADEVSGQSDQANLPLEPVQQGRRDVGIRTGSLQIADQEEDPDSISESWREELPKEEPVTKENAELLPDQEEMPPAETESEPDMLLFAGVFAGVVAAGIVILLMILEYRKHQKKTGK